MSLLQRNLTRSFINRWSHLQSPCSTYTTKLKLWDELAEPRGQILPLTTRRPNILTWYACGPTVYDSAHMGHASSYIRLDIIRRIMEHQGLTVLQVMGVTDIDDKIIERAQLRRVPWNELSQQYEQEFFQNLQQLNVKLPQVRARVSNFIPQILKFIADLLRSNSGVAYTTSDGSVYFDSTKFLNYGKFRQANPLEDSIEVDSTKHVSLKRNPSDFALWKAVKPGEPFWLAPWGKGRPGWHIECSAIATHFFGQFLDVHSGGMDLTYPHHENEEAQCCAKFGQDKWVSHWIHTGHLFLSGNVKMSKSIGNTVSIDRFLESKSADVLRMLCVMKKYNTNIEYTPETELHATSLVLKLKNFMSDLNSILLGTKRVSLNAGTCSTDLWEAMITARVKIENSLLNNFDTPSAILTLMELVGYFNSNIEIELDGASTVVNVVDFELILGFLITVQQFFSLMGFDAENQRLTDVANLPIDSVIGEFINFRGNVRNFALAGNEDDKALRKQKMEERQELMIVCDEVRRNLDACGIVIKDHGKQLSSWSFKESLTRATDKNKP